MKPPKMRCRSVLVGAGIAAIYLAALVVIVLRIDRLNYQDQHLRSMQIMSLLGALVPESFDNIASFPLIFPWQRMLLIDESREVLADSGWLENDTLTSGGSGSLFAGSQRDIAGLKRPPRIDDEYLGKLLRDAPVSGYFGLIDARTIGAGRAVTRQGTGCGVVILVDKRDLIIAKHFDHVVIAVAFLLAFLLPTILMTFVYVKLVRPLNRLAWAVRGLDLRNFECAGTLTAGDGIALPGETRSDEIGLVSAAFGTALREAGKSKAQLKIFIEDVLHELKNPISTLRSRLELTSLNGAVDGKVFALTGPDLDRLLADVGRTERLLTSLATLTDADSQEVVGNSDPTFLLRDLVAAYSALGKKVEFENRLPEGTALSIDPETFSRLIRILLDNAFDFSPPGENVVIAALADEVYVTVRVEDHGPGVPSNQREWIFRRFASTRKDGAEPHSGLGLAIAQSLVSRISSGDRRASIGVEGNHGGGAVFILIFPRA